MKITTIYKQKVESLKNDIADAISRYLKVLNIEMLTLEDDEDVFILSSEKITTVTKGEDYFLHELEISSLLFILEKLESGKYTKIE